MKDSAYHHGDLREALLAAAEDDLRRAPGTLPSIRALAAHLGVSATAPHAHFRTKADLMTALSVRGFERLRAALEDAQTDRADSAQALAALAEAYLTFARDHVGLYRLMFVTGTGLDADAELCAASRAAYDMLRGTVTACLPSLDEAAREERALAAWAVVHGLAGLAAEGRISEDTVPDRSPAALAKIAAGLVA